MIYYVFDIEADGLLHEVTKIHCLSYEKYENGTLLDSDNLVECLDIKDFFMQNDITLVGHNIIRYDIPVIEKILGIEVKCELVDTLGLSWYLYPYGSTFKHGLEAWGERFGIPKPMVTDWKSLTLEEYVYRCQEDVKINARLFREQMKYLLDIYQGEENKIIEEVIPYFNFIQDSLKEQEINGISLDISKAKKHLLDLEFEYEERLDRLSSSMPRTVAKTIPNKMYKKDGSLSKTGEKWFAELDSLSLPRHTTVIYERGNPGSHTQLKDWLFSLGWKPITFKDGKNGRVEQISLPFGQGICPSVREMFEDFPFLEDIEGLFVIRHRLGIFKAFIEYEREGKIYATAHGLANSHRLTHSVPAVNLPKPGVFYGTEIRSCLTIPNEGYVMIGSDISGLESATADHWIYPHDPKYVEERRTEGFDAHLDIALLADLISQEDSDFYKWYKSQEEHTEEETIRYKKINKIRNTAKTSNFAMTYNAFPPKIAETAKISLEEAENLFNVYWDRNWAIKKVVSDSITKKVKFNNWQYAKEGRVPFGVQIWMKNELNGFWYFVRDEKDIFSVKNQGSGNYVFNMWLKEVRKRLKEYNIPVLFQYHDELMVISELQYKDNVVEILHESMKQVNIDLKLNVEITVDADVGSNYAEVH